MINPESPAPWLDVAEAWHLFQRANRFGTPEQQVAALDEYQQATDRMALFAAAVFAAAVGALGTRDGFTPIAGYIPNDVWYRMSCILGYSGIAAEAKSASDAALLAAADVSALRVRIRELEERIDQLTPGVGQPEKK